MEFPHELWTDIMSYFHSAYKHPSHYDAIMATEHFHTNCQLIQRYNDSYRYGYYCLDSYYARIIISNWHYWSVPDIQHLLIRPQVSFRRGIATGVVLNEFKDIWNAYRCDVANRSTVLSQISYL